jgi:hypothetical protein
VSSFIIHVIIRSLRFSVIASFLFLFWQLLLSLILLSYFMFVPLYDCCSKCIVFLKI